MRCVAGLLALTLSLYLTTSVALAVGTPAGTLINSQAVVSYTQSGKVMAAVSNVLSLPVNEVLDFTLAWQDAAELSVYTGDTDAALTFRLLNTGNGHETFRLTAINALAGDDFDPATPRIHFDTNGNGQYDPLLDDIYTEGANDPELGSGALLTVFLVSDIPLDLATGQRGHLKLAVGSEEGYGIPGTVIHGQGDGGTDAIIGPGGGFSEVTGTVLVATVQIRIVKTAQVVNGSGETLAAGTVGPSAVITYTIAIENTGTGTARNVVLTDPIPAGTAYRSGSLLLNDTPLTDAADNDAGDMAENTKGAITIALGDLTSNTPTQHVSFQVTLE